MKTGQGWNQLFVSNFILLQLVEQLSVLCQCLLSKNMWHSVAVSHGQFPLASVGRCVAIDRLLHFIKLPYNFKKMVGLNDST
jgi:hypothetical protein